MPRPTIPLDVINVAEPCPVDWNDMRGDERVRLREEGVGEGDADDRHANKYRLKSY